MRAALRDGHSIDTVVFSAGNVMRAKRKLKPNLSSGHDGFPLLLIKRLSNCLAEPLSLIFTSFMSVGKIPDEWRRAIVTPVNNSGSAGDVSNYSPISLTFVFSKIMERVTVQDLLSYLMHHGLISKQQHGFIMKRSMKRSIKRKLCTTGCSR